MPLLEPRPCPEIVPFPSPARKPKIQWGSPDCRPYTSDDEVFIPTETWMEGLHELANDMACTLQRASVGVRQLGDIGAELQAIKEQVRELQTGAPITAMVSNFAPAPFAVIQPVPVTVERYEGEYRASLTDANLSAFGESQTEAVWALKDLICGTFEVLAAAAEEDKLGPGPLRQWAVLCSYLKKA